jgi:5-methylcytosine-specific restriction protein A
LTARKTISGKERLRLFVLHGGTCHFCKGKINAEREAWEVSHEIPLELGGADDDANRLPAHKKCHRDHTSAVDAPNIAKAKRRELKNLGIKPRKYQWPSRPFAQKKGTPNEHEGG